MWPEYGVGLLLVTPEPTQGFSMQASLAKIWWNEQTKATAMNERHRQPKQVAAAAEVGRDRRRRCTTKKK